MFPCMGVCLIIICIDTGLVLGVIGHNLLYHWFLLEQSLPLRPHHLVTWCHYLLALLGKQQLRWGSSHPLGQRPKILVLSPHYHLPLWHKLDP